MILYSILSKSADDKPTHITTLHSRFVPDPVRLSIFTPNHFKTDKKYPLLYLLHGYSSDHTMERKLTLNSKMYDSGIVLNL